MDVGHLGSWCRVADGEEDEGALILRATEQLCEKCHGAGRVCQGDKPDAMERCDEHPTGDAHGFLHVVVVLALSVAANPITLLEDEDVKIVGAALGSSAGAIGAAIAARSAQMADRRDQ